MKVVRLAFGCFVLLVLQMVLAPRISIGEIAPDFPLLIVAYFAVNRGALQGSIAGFVVGLIQDLFNPALLGLNALVKSVVGYGLGIAGTKAEHENLLFVGGLLTVAAAANDFFYLFFFTGLDLGRFFVLWVTISLPSAVYTALLGVVLHWLAMYFGSKVVRNLGKARS